MDKTIKIRAIPINKITQELNGDDAILALSIAMQDLALVQAFSIIHGTEKALKKYREECSVLEYNGKPVGRIELVNNVPCILWYDGIRELL